MRGTAKERIELTDEEIDGLIRGITSAVADHVALRMDLMADRLGQIEARLSALDGKSVDAARLDAITTEHERRIAAESRRDAIGLEVETV